jgi:formate dehydrogenase iron-sulfur subunit
MYAILVDVTKCIGCERCVSACLDANNLDHHRADEDRFGTRDGLSANRLLTITKIDKGRFARKACMHCVEPSCVSACLVGGLTKTAEGPVLYDAAKCIGCRYCMLACPFHIPRYQWDKTHPFVIKCTMCIDRLRTGQQPACVEACPNDALHFGKRSQLIDEARGRIKSDPTRYLQHIWGEHEYGGTCTLYISDIDLNKLGWSRFATAGIPSLTEPLIEKTPFIGTGVAICLLGVNWIIRRRIALAGPDSGEDGPNDTDGSGELRP